MSSSADMDRVIRGLEVAVDRMVQLTSARRVPAGVYGLRVRSGLDWEYDEVDTPRGSCLSGRDLFHVSDTPTFLVASVHHTHVVSDRM